MFSGFLTAELRHLVMLSFEVEPAVLEPLVPESTELDDWQGKTFLSVVGLRFRPMRVLGVPVPFRPGFEQVNLRFYVRRRTRQGWRRGVVFIREIVPRWAVAAAARYIYHEDYICLPMRSRIVPPRPEGTGIVQYAWHKDGAWNRVRAEFQGAPDYPKQGAESEFIVERYWAYARQPDGSVLEYRVEHPPWRVWHATDARFDCDVGSVYGRSFEQPLARRPVSALVADGSDVSVHRGRRMQAMPTE